MPAPSPDDRSAARRTSDEQLAAEPQLAPPDLPPSLVPQPIEAYLGRGRRIEMTEDPAPDS